MSATSESVSVRPEPFTIQVPDSDLDDLKRRIGATRWPGDLANDEWHYGTNEQYLRELLAAWKDFDWRAHEQRLNELDHYLVTIDGQTIHYVRANAGAGTPLVLLGGWPWTFWDFAEVIAGLSQFELIIAELPGQGYSMPLSAPKIGSLKTADLVHTLMTEILGHERYGIYGSDWGALIGEQMAHKYGESVIGLHTSMPFPLSFQPPDPSLYTEEEGPFAQRTAEWAQHGNAYFQLQATKPQTIAYLNDSPAAMASWIVEKIHGWTDHGGNLEDAYPRDRLLITLSIYWLTGTIGTSARFYAESVQTPWQPSHDGTPVVAVPTGVAAFPKEVAQMPRAWVEEYFDLRRYTRMERGGHFPAVEAPEALATEISTFFTEVQ
jgi:epoxide hydrolase